MNAKKSAPADRLIATAIRAQKHAHCPYSGHAVGAAVMTSNGQIFQGSNVEFSVNGLSLCAERVAVGNAVSHGQTKIVAVAVAGLKSPPCGACRQVLSEFSALTIPVYIQDVTATGRRVSLARTTLSRLLPRAYKPGPAGLIMIGRK